MTNKSQSTSVSPPSEDTLVHFVLEWLKRGSRNPDVPVESIGPETDLLDTGILDSLGFIELLTAIESKTGLPVDLSEIAPEDFTTAIGLCRYIAKSS